MSSNIIRRECIQTLTQLHVHPCRYGKINQVSFVSTRKKGINNISVNNKMHHIVQKSKQTKYIFFKSLTSIFKPILFLPVCGFPSKSSSASVKLNVYFFLFFFLFLLFAHIFFCKIALSSREEWYHSSLS